MKPFPGTLTMQFVDRPFTTKTGKDGCQRVMAWVLTDEQQEWLRRWYPETENSRLMKASGMSHSTLHRFARQMGLVKSERGLKGIIKRTAKRIKTICERSGYYDSIRGQQPSEACRQATAQMWQDIRDGKREHPFRIMRRKNPRRYKKFMQRKSDERKQTIKRERARMLFGLERKTRLRAVVVDKYTKSQVSHRYNAQRRGYIIAADCSEGSGHRYTIYFDDATKRSPQFEQNLLADGFRLKRWQW